MILNDSIFGAQNIDYINELYDNYKSDPKSVDNSWQYFFKGYDYGLHHANINQNKDIPDEFKVLNLIYEYRSRGHLFAQINPLKEREKNYPDLSIENFGLDKSNLEKQYESGKLISIGKSSLSNIINHLKDTYCRSVGVEYMYIRKPEIVNWLQKKMESCRNEPNFSPDKKYTILKQLTETFIFEKFANSNFVGHKRFSIEGGESLIPALHSIIELFKNAGGKKTIIGMSHRGRLNVLANVLKKPLENIFNEFEGKEYDDINILGDVKYHLGYTYKDTISQFETSLCPNPSHLEAVCPVVEGLSKAFIEIYNNNDNSKVLPILLHGDASFSAQGIIYEVLQMSQLEGYKVGGTIHIIINNQIGFTTDVKDAKSSIYCTDIAKILQVPIFHVNADDIEAVIYVSELATEFRQTFKKDVFIDLVCYRRFGHNETDEPRFTQPIMYKLIDKHPDVLSIYEKKLLSEKIIKEEELTFIHNEIYKKLEKALNNAKIQKTSKITNFLENIQNKIIEHHKKYNINEYLDDIAFKLTTYKKEMKIFYKLEKIIKERKINYFEKNRVDWAFAELLAFGSLIHEGYNVRLSGQDVKRGTFSQRHAYFKDENTEKEYNPFDSIAEGKFKCYNSPLSEYGVLGFDYGYSLGAPNTLVIWEAQFGDFANGAQIIFDQFIFSAEEKWNLKSKITILLPHGYEGQGPEHSSARIERILTLCANNNVIVANCTTPANYFHLLRNQMINTVYKPLIIFTPKSLLRHQLCISPISELKYGLFKPVIDDNLVDKTKVDTILFCSGKIFYELYSEREKNNYYNYAIIRIEKLYPFPEKELKEVINSYKDIKKYYWVQEEPANMGAWTYIKRVFNLIPLTLISRPESGSPAGGSITLHNLRQRKIIEKSFNNCSCERKDIECKMICAPFEYNYLYNQSTQ